VKQSNTVPRWIQGISGIALLFIALAAAGLSLAVNWIAGMMVGLPIAVMFALSDTAKILVPVICQAIGFNRHLRATYIVASVVSVLCALLAMADYFGSRLAETDNRATITANSDQRIDDLRASLASVRTMAAEEAQRGGCGDKCKLLIGKASNLETSLSKAVSAREGQNTAETITGKGLLAQKLAGIAPGVTDTASAVVLILAGLLMMELCAHMAGPAANMIGLAMKRREQPAPAPKAKAPAKAKKKTTRAKRWSPAQTQKMLQQALQKPDGRKIRARNSNVKIARPANENVDA